MQKYKDEYCKQYSCIVKSSKSDEHAFCRIFSADISISRILPYFGALSPFFKLCRLASLLYLSHSVTQKFVLGSFDNVNFNKNFSSCTDITMIN